MLHRVKPNNWMSRYDPTTGRGAIGVEFAGTGVTSTTGPFDRGDFNAAVNVSSIYVRDNIDLQWSEGFFRGFFTLAISPKVLNATYYSMRNVSKCTLLTFHNPLSFVSVSSFPEPRRFPYCYFPGQCWRESPRSSCCRWKGLVWSVKISGGELGTSGVLERHIGSFVCKCDEFVLNRMMEVSVRNSKLFPTEIGERALRSFT